MRQNLASVAAVGRLGVWRLGVWCVVVAGALGLGGCGASRPDGNTPLSVVSSSIFHDDPRSELIVHDVASVRVSDFSTQGVAALSTVLGRDAWAAMQLAEGGVPDSVPTLTTTEGKAYRAGAILTSPVIELRRSVQEILPSWNIDVAGAQAGLRIEVRAGNTRLSQWTPWFDLGGAGIERPASWGPLQTKVAGDFAARVDIDVLVLTGVPADRVQYRLIGFGTGPVFVSAVSICASVTDSDGGKAGGTPAPQGSSRGRLGLPFKSQRTQRDELSGRLCSPTSVTMVVTAATRKPILVQTTAELAYDKSHDIYGNWPRNVQAAFELGARGFVTRYSSWSQVEQTLARGIPIVASIRVKPGELRNAPYPKTDGHLIVIEGLDDNGDVLVLDPASPDEKTGTLTYLREDMTKVWFGGSDGTAYVLLPK
jgi:hypothetical protein